MLIRLLSHIEGAYLLLYNLTRSHVALYSLHYTPHPTAPPILLVLNIIYTHIEGIKLS